MKDSKHAQGYGKGKDVNIDWTTKDTRGEIEKMLPRKNNRCPKDCRSDCSECSQKDFRMHDMTISDTASALEKRVASEDDVGAWIFWYIGIEIAENRSIDMHEHETRERLTKALRKEFVILKRG